MMIMVMLQISPTILTSCDEKELGSMRHRRAENTTTASFGRSEMTSRLNISASSVTYYLQWST